MPSKTKQLAENALMLGIALILLFLSTYTVLGVVTVLLLPLPFLLLGLNRNVSTMVWITLAFAVLGSVIAGIVSAVLACMAAITGSVMGIVYTKKGKALFAIAAGAAAVFLGYMLMLATMTFGMNISFEEMLKQADSYRPEFMPKEQYDQIMDMVKLVMPAFFVVSSFMQSAITHGFARLIGKRLKRPVPALPPIRNWNFPRSLLYYYFFTMIVMLLFSESLKGTFWESAVYNVKTVLDLVFILQGLSFCLFAADLYGWKRLAPVLVVSLFIFPFLTTILSLIGIFDMGIRLRDKLETRVKRG